MKAGDINKAEEQNSRENAIPGPHKNKFRSPFHYACSSVRPPSGAGMAFSCVFLSHNCVTDGFSSNDRRLINPIRNTEGLPCIDSESEHHSTQLIHQRVQEEKPPNKNKLRGHKKLSISRTEAL